MNKSDCGKYYKLRHNNRKSNAGAEFVRLRDALSTVPYGLVQ